MKNESPPRPYRQTSRAKAAADTADRIVASFTARMEASWFDEIRLEDVAADASVTVQTIIRRFGGKEGLLEACEAKMKADILKSRRASPGDVGRALDVIVAEYEKLGPLVLRLLAQETRYGPIKTITDTGRAHHRSWVDAVFAPWLDKLPTARRTEALDRLVIAMDVYVWKLLFVDMRRSTSDVRETMLAMCAAALGLSIEELEPTHPVLSETIDG